MLFINKKPQVKSVVGVNRLVPFTACEVSWRVRTERCPSRSRARRTPSFGSSALRSRFPEIRLTRIIMLS